ncbi:hypothetical protein KIL84_004992, partial [Mauremys mutica]
MINTSGNAHIAEYLEVAVKAITKTENQVCSLVADNAANVRKMKKKIPETNLGKDHEGNLKYLEELLKEPEQPNTSMASYMKFSVWVSFCEIYNECIYDLLLPVSNDKKRRVLLRLAQDIKGCSYVKDLQWIQVSDSKEAFKLLKLGLKHQSIACTKLNTYSSRSHSIFTVKMLKIEDSEPPNVTRVSELQLHIPFRESKLTHFLQGFFSGKGKVYMIVNISQCAGAYDETLNVLKFSAIAQKICVLDASNAPQDHPFVQKSAREVSLINNVDTKIQVARKRATVLWDRSLEDVIEDDDDLTVDNNETHEEHDMAKEMPNEEEENKVIIGKEDYLRLLNIIEDLKSKLINERKDKLLLELKIREEVAQELTQYLAQQETDFRQCLSYERELLEEASEQRLEIYKDLVNECAKNLDEEQEIKDSHCNERAGMLAFTASSILHTHIRQHSGEKPFKCRHCGKAFASHAAHDSHVQRTHDKDKGCTCTVCGKNFLEQEEFRFHMKFHAAF